MIFNYISTQELREPCCLYMTQSKMQRMQCECVFLSVCSASLPCVTVRRIMRLDRTLVWGQGLRNGGQCQDPPVFSWCSSVAGAVMGVRSLDSSFPICRTATDGAVCCVNTYKVSDSTCNQRILLPFSCKLRNVKNTTSVWRRAHGLRPSQKNLLTTAII